MNMIDLGDGHTLEFTSWNPDRELNPQYVHLPDVERFGATIEHVKPDGETCMSAVTFDAPVARELLPGAAIWQVESWEPLTLSPSLLCRRCGDHGFIKEGKWVRA